MKTIPKDRTPKLERKIVERNRRIHMKGLCFNLVSLIPHQHYSKLCFSKKMLTQQDQIDLAASYITKLRESIEKLKTRKEQAIKSSNENNNNNNNNNLILDDNSLRMVNNNVATSWPVIELKDLGSSIEVILISGLQKNFMLYEVISVLEEEGAQVVSASFSNVGDKVFHSIHAMVKISRVGVDTTRVWQRLQELIY